mmetsp:Transcript_8957/g.26336  ORF Transcript_8957/g.26336 Transcript_8957/m.26336 type:complete len:223 (-) Transcript_8957:515-1183(-)
MRSTRATVAVVPTRSKAWESFCSASRRPSSAMAKELSRANVGSCPAASSADTMAGRCRDTSSATCSPPCPSKTPKRAALAWLVCRTFRRLPPRTERSKTPQALSSIVDLCPCRPHQQNARQSSLPLALSRLGVTAGTGWAHLLCAFGGPSRFRSASSRSCSTVAGPATIIAAGRVGSGAVSLMMSPGSPPTTRWQRSFSAYKTFEPSRASLPTRCFHCPTVQ